MWVKLHHVLILDVVRFINELADDVIIVFIIDDPEKLNFLVSNIGCGKFGFDRLVILNLCD